MGGRSSKEKAPMEGKEDPLPEILQKSSQGGLLGGTVDTVLLLKAIGPELKSALRPNT